MPVADAPIQLLPEPGSLIGDRMVTDGSGGEYQHVYAATGRPTKRALLAGEKEVDEAVRAAREAFPAWCRMPADQKRRLFLKYAELVSREADLLIRLNTVDTSMPLAFGADHINALAHSFEYNAGWVDRIGGEIIPTWHQRRSLDYTLDEPYGVIGAMTPFNAPVMAAGMVLGPILAAGNTAVLKPNHISPFAIVRVGQLFLEAGFPPGVVNVVPGDAMTGEAVVRHPGVDKVFFMGSGRSAKYVMRACADGLKSMALELGGKSADIVFDDVDIARSAQLGAYACFVNGGQGCALGTRLLVQSSIYDEFVDECVKVAKGIRVGDPVDNAVVMGPVINETACERILGVIDTAKAEHQGEMLTGGSRLGGDLAPGYFVEPTVFADVDNSTMLAQDEIFGPVLSIIRFDTEDDAVRIANSTPFGLAAVIHSHNLERVHRVASDLDAGIVFVNNFASPEGMPISVPFGGVKRSGFGRLGGMAAIREFTRPKNVVVDLSDE